MQTRSDSQQAELAAAHAQASKSPPQRQPKAATPKQQHQHARAAPLPAQSVQPPASTTSSADWDVMGDEDEEAAQAVVHIRANSLGANAAAAQPNAGAAQDMVERLARHNSAKGLPQQASHIPRFETGEPQYQFGDGGGPPSSTDSRYQEVMGVSVQYV